MASAAFCYAAGSTISDAATVVLGNATANLLQQQEDSLIVKKDSLVYYNGSAYTVPNIFSIADSLHYAYDFSMADSLLTKALEISSDSLSRLIISDEITSIRNGAAMMEYCSQPNVVAKQRFSLSDFFLFYPLKNNSWRNSPNQLDTLKDNRFVSATYIPDGEKLICWSSPDSSGTREIYYSNWVDSLWTMPNSISDRMTDSDEIFPMLSSDGKTMYFASDGLFGMGGFDLYQCSWDEVNQEWSTPSNLGFPYSSPADDFLYCNTEDGRYTLFASNRECSMDSVYIYVLEFDSMPLHKAITNPADLKQLCLLIPEDRSRIDIGSAVTSQLTENPETQKYMEMMTNVRHLRDSLYALNKELDALRNEASSSENLDSLKNQILQKEMSLPALQATVDAAVKDLHKVEMEFLSGGMLVDLDMMKQEVQREVVGAEAGYTFSRNSIGKSLSLEFEVPKQEIPEVDEEREKH